MSSDHSSNPIMMAMSNGITINDTFQQFVDVYCYVDVPIDVIINKLQNINTQQNILQMLNNMSCVINTWLKNLQNQPQSVDKYIEFLQHHKLDVRNFVRIALNSVKGLYAKINKDNTEFIGIDQEYEKMFKEFVNYFNLDQINVPIGVDLRTVDCTDKCRPWLVCPTHKNDICIKLMQTSF